MRVVRGSAALPGPPRRPVLTIGNFDGIHIGHRAILRTVTDRARALDGESVVYTFDPHPRKVLQGERAPGLLATTEQKLEPGVPEEYIIAGKKVMTDEQHVGWTQGVKDLYDAMVRITVTPTWVKLIDFETTLPKDVEDLIRAKQAQG